MLLPVRTLVNLNIGRLLDVVLGLGQVLAEQSFLEQPSSVISAPGGNGNTEIILISSDICPGSVTLTCLVTNQGGECRWQKDGKPVGMYPGKYSPAEAEGDCSLSILDVDLRLDDGQWQCQVTGTSFTSQDALASAEARLTVMMAPESVEITRNHEVLDSEELSVKEGAEERVACVTRMSNPAPQITWYLGNTRLVTVEQTNVTERELHDRWRSEAVLTHRFTVQDADKRLSCRVSHAGYGARGYREAGVRLGVMYRPIVTISREDSGDSLEAGLGWVSLTCLVEASPASEVSWTRLDPVTGAQSLVTRGERLELRPVRRDTGGTYICTASNSVGQSDPGQTVVTVLYPPSRVETRPAPGIVKLPVNNRTR